jgi:hypothetical protein
MRYREATSMNAAGSEAVWSVPRSRSCRPARDCGLDAVEDRIARGDTMEFRTHVVAPSRST